MSQGPGFDPKQKPGWELVRRARIEIEKHGGRGPGRVRIGPISINWNYVTAHARLDSDKPHETHPLVGFERNKWTGYLYTSIGELEHVYTALAIMRKHQLLDDLADL